MSFGTDMGLVPSSPLLHLYSGHIQSFDWSSATWGGVLSEAGDFGQSSDPFLVMGTEEEKKHLSPEARSQSANFKGPSIEKTPRELILGVLGAKLNIFQHS